MSDDLAIVQLVLGGDREAFRTLVERHQGMVLGVVTRLAGDRDSAEELAQETFVRAYQGLASFRGEARFSTWLVQIALHVARNHLKRKRRNAKVVSLDELQERDAMDSRWLRETRRSFSADGGVENQELAVRLGRAMDQLPHSYREVFVLKHVQEMSYEEIARITGDSVGSLKVRAHRARSILREALSDEAEARGDGSTARGDGTADSRG